MQLADKVIVEKSKIKEKTNTKKLGNFNSERNQFSNNSLSMSIRMKINSFQEKINNFSFNLNSFKNSKPSSGFSSIRIERLKRLSMCYNDMIREFEPIFMVQFQQTTSKVVQSIIGENLNLESSFTNKIDTQDQRLL